MTMFRRRPSHKPSEELLSTFRQQYTELLPLLDHQTEAPTTQPGQTPNLAFDPNNFQGISGRTDGLFTSGSFDIPTEWRPSGLLDPNVDGFQDLSQAGGYWPPTPHGSSIYGGTQAEVHAQQAVFGMETPVSGSSVQAPSFPPQHGSFSGHEFMNAARMGSFPPHQPFEESRSLAPNALHDQSSNMGSVDAQTHGLRLSDVNLAQSYGQSQFHPPGRSVQQVSENIGPRLVVDAMKQFRFRSILKAQTAMIKHPHDIPVTYLNKSQTYNILIDDTCVGRGLASSNLRYRTAVRIAFEDDQQRRNPATSWQLWNEGRGTNEAIKRGGRKPKAVELVTQDQSHSDSRSNIEVTAEHFDGFSVTWSPSSEDAASCNIQLRFNFLSTDFSHSKGVKGVPVRLCAKTEIIEGQQLLPPCPAEREVCYCAVKIFRDHGAERKLANDRAHIDKLIDKFTNQAEQAESSAKESGKRRRSDSMVSARPSKVAKHKRTWSMSSSGSLDDPQDAPDDELLVRIRSLKAMPDSIRPVSAFYLRGEDQDDLDNHPVILSSNSPTTSTSASTRPPSLRTDTTHTTSRSTAGFNSETSVSRSPSMMRVKGEPPQQLGTPVESLLTPTIPGKSPVRQEVTRSAPQQLASPPSSGPMKAKMPDALFVPTQYPRIQGALDVDNTYQSPTESKTCAVAEFFMKPSIAGKPSIDDNYRAIYLSNRTLKELVRAIEIKCGIGPGSIISTIRVNDQHLPITAEDDMVEQMPERQDFIAELDIADDTHNSAAQFLESQDDLTSEGGSGPKYKLTLRY